MKEKWTKLGKSLICLALVTSMLAGCGGGGNSSSSSGEQTSGGTSGEVATGDDNFNETGLPIVKEPVELTFLYVKGANTMDFKDNAMFQQMEKDTNVKINWQYAGDADWSEQKSLLLASGDLPDVFFGDNTITTACEHPEVAMRWADYFSTDDISVQSYWGPYGVSLNKDEDGNITFLDPPEGKTGDQWYWEITPRDYGPKYVTPEFEAKITLPENSGDGAKLKEDEIMKEFVAKPYPVVNYTAEQSEEISSLTVDIYKYVNETWASWIVNGGIDEQWDAYVDQLNQMGLERLMEIYQEALDVYNNAG